MWEKHRVWHDGLLFKLQSFLPALYYLIIKSYLDERFFSGRHGNNSMSAYHIIKAGIPQGSALFPLLYYILTHDIPKTINTILATNANDIAILLSNNDPQIVTQLVQNHFNLSHHGLSNRKSS
jgi:hypothetical protein